MCRYAGTWGLREGGAAIKCLLILLGFVWSGCVLCCVDDSLEDPHGRVGKVSHSPELRGAFHLAETLGQTRRRTLIMRQRDANETLGGNGKEMLFIQSCNDMGVDT
ncbi:hypothetical protein E2C01_058584 [Portunus trituberculatus]|uniref:Secreted protein n=1 Tax=Portunus trituberculatus TaxID=210409 RepID=A0A5B7H542_PORTR|nr:hypothetical protein [Portunus trituberculatus]